MKNKEKQILTSINIYIYRAYIQIFTFKNFTFQIKVNLYIKNNHIVQ